MRTPLTDAAGVALTLLACVTLGYAFVAPAGLWELSATTYALSIYCAARLLHLPSR